jgi:hypothetical protein
MEDYEASQERQAVGGKVRAVGDEHPADAADLERLGQGHAQLGGQAEDDPGAHGDQPERQGFLQQLRLALALPRPAAEDVAHACADDRREAA